MIYYLFNLYYERAKIRPWTDTGGNFLKVNNSSCLKGASRQVTRIKEKWTQAQFKREGATGITREIQNVMGIYKRERLLTGLSKQTFLKCLLCA